MPRVRKSSEIKLVGEVHKAVALKLAPLEAWNVIKDPDVYLEGRAGKYISGLEMLLEKAIELNDFDAVRGITIDLLRMTKLGRSKADLNVGVLDKLRPDADFSAASTEELERLLHRRKVENE